MNDELKNAVQTLAKALREDPGYWISWQANIAMQFQDECSRHGAKDLADNIHPISNRAANNFLDLLCRESP